MQRQRKAADPMYPATYHRRNQCAIVRVSPASPTLQARRARRADTSGARLRSLEIDITRRLGEPAAIAVQRPVEVLPIAAPHGSCLEESAYSARARADQRRLVRLVRCITVIDERKRGRILDGDAGLEFAELLRKAGPLDPEPTVPVVDAATAVAAEVDLRVRQCGDSPACVRVRHLRYRDR